MELINNKVNKGPAYSRWLAYNKAHNNEICVFLDGDDWLINNKTLAILSNVYSKNKIYATFGSMKDEYWQYKKWKDYNREDHNYFPHLRTAYAFLCKKVPVEYLKFNENEWFQFKTDVALFTSICELCENKYAFLKTEFIYYNKDNSNNNPNTGFNCKNKTDIQKQKRILYHNTITSFKKLEPIV